METPLYTMAAMLMAWLLTEMTKSKRCRNVWDKVPRRAKRLIPLFLGMLAASLQQLASGSSLSGPEMISAVETMLSVAGGSMLIHEAGMKGALGRQMKEVPAEPQKAKRSRSKK